MDRWWLLLESSQSGGGNLAFALSEGEIIFGRGPDVDVLLLDERMSRRHAAISLLGDALTLRDLGSTTGTRVNGEVIQERVLAAGDRIDLGDTVMRVDRKIPSATEVSTATTKVKDFMGAQSWRPFRALLDKLRATTGARELLGRLLEGLVDLVGAQRGFVLLKRRPGSELVPVASHGVSPKEQAEISRTVCARAIKARTSLVIPDSSQDECCAGAKSLAMAPNPMSIICSPLVAEGEVLGAIYIDRPGGGAELLPAQFNLLEAMVAMAAELIAAKAIRQDLLAAEGRLQALATLTRAGGAFRLDDGPVCRKLRSLLTAAAKQDVTVLFTGETGTGKEMAARALHELSARREGPFVPVHCAALPRELLEAELFGVAKGSFTGATADRAGRFEAAAGGTLFLDEVGEMPLEVQVKLLRVLQERAVTRLGETRLRALNLRLVCATNSDLEEAVRRGDFREDFYYRINVLRVELPPLRERPDSILLLARHFLKDFVAKSGRPVRGISPTAERALMTYHWPGNVRELRNAIERAVVVETGEDIRAESLSVPVTKQGTDGGIQSQDLLLKAIPMDYEEARDAFDRAFLERALEAGDEKLRKVARMTGMARTTLYRKLAKLGLGPPDKS